MNQAKKYRKKPVEIEAVQWDGTEQGVVDIVEWAEPYDNQPDHTAFLPWGGGGSPLLIETLEGVMQVQSGDYIIKGIKGEFYPCKPDIFEQSYEEV